MKTLRFQLQMKKKMQVKKRNLKNNKIKNKQIKKLFQTKNHELKYFVCLGFPENDLRYIYQCSQLKSENFVQQNK